MKHLLILIYHWNLFLKVDTLIYGTPIQVIQAQDMDIWPWITKIWASVLLILSSKDRPQLPKNSRGRGHHRPLLSLHGLCVIFHSGSPSLYLDPLVGWTKSVVKTESLAALVTVGWQWLVLAGLFIFRFLAYHLNNTFSLLYLLKKNRFYHSFFKTDVWPNFYHIR